jgi:hypothetical protein
LEEVKMKKIILILIVVITVIPFQSAKTQTTKPQAENEQSPDEIELYVLKCRQEIENYYQNRLTELQLSAIADIRLLEIAEKPQTTCTGLQEWAEFAEAVIQINNLENHSFNYTTHTPAERLAIALSRITQRKNEILAGLEWQTNKLEKLHEYASTKGLNKLEKKMQEKLTATAPEKTQGVVAGIIYSQDDPVAIIDDTIVRQGETIYGVKVVRINKRNVEFTKDDNNWTQKSREIRAKNWK